MEIECGACRLRPWRRDDQQSLIRNANNRAIWLNLRDRFPHPYTVRDAEAWIQSESVREVPINFAIQIAGEAVGGIGFTLGGDIERTSAEIGYWLGESFWGCGFMSAAVRGATEYALAKFGLTRVYALPFSQNSASIRVLEKSGYTREGLLRRSAVKDGTVLDQVLFAITDLDLRSMPGA